MTDVESGIRPSWTGSRHPTTGSADSCFSARCAGVYLIAFVSAALQFRALIGERGLTPVPQFVRRVPFWTAPSLFHWRYSDRLFAGCCWTGAALAAAMTAGAADAVPLWASMLMWAALWLGYLSIVNVGQTLVRVRLGVAAAGGGLSRDLPRQR